MNKNFKTTRVKEGDNKPTRYFSKKQENKVAKELSGQRQINSGATPFIKGDVSTDLFLIECKTKTTPCKSISIHKEWLEKNDKESLLMGKKYSALAFDFGDGDLHYIIDRYLFEELCDYLEGNDENNC